MIRLSLEDLKTKTRKLIIYGIGEKILSQIEKLIPRYSLIGDTVFFEPQQFSWTAELEFNWKTIRQELDEILKYRDNLPNFQDISPEQYNITKKERA